MQIIGWEMQKTATIPCVLVSMGTIRLGPGLSWRHDNLKFNDWQVLLLMACATILPIQFSSLLRWKSRHKLGKVVTWPRHRVYVRPQGGGSHQQRPHIRNQGCVADFYDQHSFPCNLTHHLNLYLCWTMEGTVLEEDTKPCHLQTNQAVIVEFIPSILSVWLSLYFCYIAVISEHTHCTLWSSSAKKDSVRKRKVQVD